MAAGVLGAAALGIEEGDAGRVGAAPGAVVARERPEPASLRPAAAGIEHRGTRLVDEEPGRGLQGFDQPGVDRTELARRVADPVGERRAVERQTLTGEDLCLAVERQVVGVFADEHMRDHGFGRQPSGDQPGRSRRLHDALGAAPAGVSRPAGDEHPELRRDDVEPLGDVLPDPMQPAAAARAVEALRLDDPLDPRQVPRQRAAVGAPTLSARPLQRRVGGIRLGPVRGDLLLGILQRQLELAGVELLRAPAEHRPLEGIDDGREPRDLLGQVEPRTALGRQHRLQRRGIVRQVGSIETGSDIAHGHMWSTGRRGCDRQHPA